MKVEILVRLEAATEGDPDLYPGDVYDGPSAEAFAQAGVARVIEEDAPEESED